MHGVSQVRQLTGVLANSLFGCDIVPCPSNTSYYVADVADCRRSIYRTFMHVRSFCGTPVIPVLPTKVCVHA